MRISWILAAVAFAAACTTAHGPAGATGEPATPAPETLQSTEPVGEPTGRLAALGSRVFEGRGCGACHTIGAGPSVGPDLAGVTARRDPEWFRAMVTRPDSMLRHDPRARALHERYASAMPALGVDDVEAEALWEFLAVAAAPSSFVETDPRELRRGPGACPHHAGRRGDRVHGRRGHRGPG
ncbi:MAG: cytochrome c [Gemmatimonadota bacterium]|nr:cytochrome c [Gemmatimonadota bacterium]